MAFSASLQKAYAAEGFSKMAALKWKPAGSMIATKGGLNGLKWAFDCQHGAQECTYNTIEGCAADLIGSKDGNDLLTFNFLNCIEANNSSSDFEAVIDKCASSAAIDPNMTVSIKNCYESQDGNDSAHRFTVQTQKLTPVPDTFPFFVMNDTDVSLNVQMGGNTDLLGLVCKNYTGPHKSADCPASSFL